MVSRGCWILDGIAIHKSKLFQGSPWTLGLRRVAMGFPWLLGGKNAADSLHIIWSKLTPCHCFGCVLLCFFRSLIQTVMWHDMISFHHCTWFCRICPSCSMMFPSSSKGALAPMLLFQGGTRQQRYSQRGLVIQAVWIRHTRHRWRGFHP